MSITAHNEADILERLIDPQKPGFSSEAARWFLSLSFSPDDVARMNELSRKASEGTLTEQEQQTLNSYEGIGHLLAIIQSKARRSLASLTSDSPES
jgi:hypothetical protein